GPPRDVVAEDVLVEGQLVPITAVNVGNPHCVVFVDDPVAADLHRLGPALEHAPLFPRRTHVQLARAEGPDPVRGRCGRRGGGGVGGRGGRGVGGGVGSPGRGSPACAAPPPGARWGPPGPAVTVCMDGGMLRVEVGTGWTLRMTGPSTLVYRGTLAPSFVTQL